MVSARDVANFFIDTANKDTFGDGVTNMRVNKLLYFAQGHYFARTGNQLFDDDFEAWEFGPVVPSIYQLYKGYGRNPIDEVDEDYNHAAFAPDELELLIDVTREYGKYTTSKLVDFTHCPTSPWGEVFGKPNQLITKEKIKIYFESIDTLETFDAILSTLDLPVYDNRDSDGILLLPSDDDYYAEHDDGV